MIGLFTGSASVALALALLLATSGFLLLLVGLSRPVFFRISLRNMVRRPGQTLILVGGLLLSTVFITASLGLLDSFSASEHSYRLAQLGRVDEAVSGPFSVEQFAETSAALQRQPGVQATAGLLLLRHGADVTNQRTQRTQIQLDVYGIPPAFDQVYGALTDTQGHPVHFADVRPDEILLSATVAKITDVRPGDRLNIQTEVGQLSSAVGHILSTDVVVTSGELLSNAPFPEIFLPLATFQQMYEQGLHHPVAPNVLCIRNTSQGLAQPILRLLQHIFHIAPLDPRIHIPGTTNFDVLQIHPLRTVIVETLSGVPFTSGLALDNSPAGREYELLLPACTWLLLGSGMLFLVLLCLLLATERRSELGISRALGLQRAHLVQLFLLEACGYGLLAALLGVPLGVAAVALELWALGQLPAVDLGPGVVASRAFHVPLQLQVSWQTLLSASCLSVLLTAGVVCLAAVWISRLNIVAAIRQLDSAGKEHSTLADVLHALWRRQRLSSAVGAGGKLLWGLFWRGPLCLLAGVVLYESGQTWLQVTGVLLLLTSAGLLVLWASWTVKRRRWVSQLLQHLAGSWIGASWIVYGAQLDNKGLFSALAPLSHVSFDSATVGQGALLLSLLLQIGGCVVIVMSNLDLLAALLSLLLRRSRFLAPLSRLSLSYPLTSRARSWVSVTLFSSITFLIVLLLTNNLGQAQQGQVQTTTGNFQIEVQLTPDEQQQVGAAVLNVSRRLPQEVAAVCQMHLLYDPVNQDGTAPQPARLELPGEPVQQIATAPLSGPLVVDDTFLDLTSMPLFASAQGYASDAQVWEALKQQPGSAVMRYDPGLKGLPTGSGFNPFSVDVPVSSAHAASLHRLKIIGLLPANAHWPNVLLSQGTASQITPHLSSFVSYYYLRLQPGIQTDLAISRLDQFLQTGRFGIHLVSLDAADASTLTADLTLFLVSYLASGLLFGALSISVIVSRAVVERRQQIGMLRALGFSPARILAAFFVEASFLISTGLATGTALALWLAAQIARQLYQNAPIPLPEIVLLFLGSSLIALIFIAVPARRAAHISPAEALRYE